MSDMEHCVRVERRDNQWRVISLTPDGTERVAGTHSLQADAELFAAGLRWALCLCDVTGECRPAEGQP